MAGQHALDRSGDYDALYRNYLMLQKEIDHLSILREIALAINSSIELSEVLPVIAQVVQGALDVSRLTIYELDGQSTLAKPIVAKFDDDLIDSERLEEESMQLVGTPLGQAIRTRVPVLLNTKTQSAAFIPLLAKGVPIGVMRIEDRLDGTLYEKDMTSLLQSIGSMIALAVVVAAYSLKQGVAGLVNPSAAWALLDMGLITLFSAMLWTVVGACRERLRDGVLCLLVPFYCIYYAAARRMTGPGRIMIGGLSLLGTSAVLWWLLWTGHADRVEAFFAARPAAWTLVCAALAVVATTLAGTLNGITIVGPRIVPFIVTLGAMGIFRGLAKGIANEKDVDPPDTWLVDIMDPTLPSFVNWVTGQSPHRPEGFDWLVLPPGVWILVLAAVGAGLFLHYSRLGRHIFAIGSNEETARLCGVPVGRTKIVVYALAGFFAGLAGLMQFAYEGGIGSPTTAISYELFVIAAVVVGGGSLMGGEGSILGSVIGALIITILYMGGQQMDWPKREDKRGSGYFFRVSSSRVKVA